MRVIFAWLTKTSEYIICISHSSPEEGSNSSLRPAFYVPQRTLYSLWPSVVIFLGVFLEMLLRDGGPFTNFGNK